MNILSKLRQIPRRAIRTGKGLTGVSKLINDPALSRTYFPEAERKSKFTILMDNLIYLVRHGEVNNYYYVFGMDRKNSNGQDFLPYTQFRYLRNSKNRRPPHGKGYSYVCILRDKFVFSQFLKSLSIPSPQNIALLSPNGITWFKDMKHTSLEYLIEDPNININGFCKELGGILGKGAFPLEVKGQKLFVNGKEITLNQLKEKLVSQGKIKQEGQYLLQKRLTQHPKMSELHPHSINTIRLNSFNNNGKVEILCASLRMGTKGKNVDNWASGGIVIGIDLATGKLVGEGVFKYGYGGRVQEHPDTGIKLEGFEIPFFSEAVKLTCELHSYLYGIHSVGWDIAITPEGPVIIEGNDDWEGGIPMALEKDFKSRFLEHYRS